jgi:hypothetical protein
MCVVYAMYGVIVMNKHTQIKRGMLYILTLCYSPSADK